MSIDNKIKRFLQKIRDIPSEIKWFIQRGRRGYADWNRWCLNSYICGWLPSALREMAGQALGHPSEITFKEWGKILKEMALGFEAGAILSGRDFKDKKEHKKLMVKFDKGMKLFHKHFFDLWD